MRRFWRISCPDSLTNFINWAAANYPAKKYILVLADHGGGYMPHTDLADAKAPTRALIFDDGYMDGGNKKCFSGKSFARALRNANVRIDGIVFYLCLMNNMEFLYEVKDVTDYIACSTYILLGLGGALQTIIDNFAAGQDIETALGNFMDATMKSFDGFFYRPETIDQYKYNGEGAKNISFIEDYELTGTDTWPSTFADTYQYTTFDRLVGWSRWLLLNEEEPSSWSPNSFRYRLPGDDMSGIPII